MKVALFDMRVVAIALCAATVVAASSLSAQDIGLPAAHAGTTSLFVTVMDKDHRFVPDLTADQFEIYDNGKVQSVTSLERKPQPLNVVVMLDTSGSMRTMLDPAIQAADEFLTRLSIDDVALVCGFNDKATFQPDTGFTNSLPLLRQGLGQLGLGFPTGLYDALGHSIERLKNRTGRRIVVALTDGEDNASKLNANEIIRRARIADVTVFTIGAEHEYFDGKYRVKASPDRGLKNISAETGGGVALLKEVAHWGPAFAAVAHELHSQYVINFSPSILDGKVHQIEVRLKNPALSVRVRKSYLARLGSAE